MQNVDFSIQSAWLGWEHGCKIELNFTHPVHAMMDSQLAPLRPLAVQDMQTISRR